MPAPEINDYDQAIADYAKAIELNPEDAVAYNNRDWFMLI